MATRSPSFTAWMNAAAATLALMQIRVPEKAGRARRKPAQLPKPKHDKRKTVKAARAQNRNKK